MSSRLNLAGKGDSPAAAAPQLRIQDVRLEYEVRGGKSVLAAR